MNDICKCGHSEDMHVRLPGHPDGVEECQEDDCDCGKFRPKQLSRFDWAGNDD